MLSDTQHTVTKSVPIDLIDSFPDHPFKVRMDEDMHELMESIREYGLIEPMILRQKEDGRYEIVSGHRRMKACELIGMTSVRAEVRSMSRDEAVIAMVDSNLHRSHILPSEKAFAYKMKLEAMRRLPGRPSMKNGGPLDHHYLGKKSRDILADEIGDSSRQISRYIRLTELNKDILEMVDEGKIAMRPAVEISYLSGNEQELLSEMMELTDNTPSHAQAIRLREMSGKGDLSYNAIKNILSEEKPNQKEQIRVRYEFVSRYLPKDLPFSETESYILEALEYYKEHRDRERDRELDRGAR